MSVSHGFYVIAMQPKNKTALGTAEITLFHIVQKYSYRVGLMCIRPKGVE